ncbi:GntR family transcriptional regulator [Streptococcus pyogenes]|uniref:GntR family transcriptional regulator n=1 Tax=Streptococcus pyogenes TaxID=1314 RepID=UPI0010A102C7|nr:GntR family transcriptional regulator [Streptococcus pyogenes]VGQ63942.1 GntR family transcriptional regulator [Streptococcus pyogenes]VHB98695.1 GntR family transcriptional regulator [Streptococcus pyogenes]VHC35823.1 GntR family transcriptional regulator [Streptococcus pyogenes]
MPKEQPLYLQIVDDLEVKIKKSMTENDKLLSERELSDLYGVSRITIRLALKELELRDLIYKKQGKGTYVSGIKEPVTDLSSTYSFTEQMKKMGKMPKTEILSFEQYQVTPYLSGLLELDPDTEVFELERLRIADDMPLMFERSYIPAQPFQGLSIALDYEAGLLGIKKGDPVLHIIRKTYNDNNILIELTFSIARADQFRYRVQHHPNG